MQISNKSFLIDKEKKDSTTTKKKKCNKGLVVKNLNDYQKRKITNCC